LLSIQKIAAEFLFSRFLRVFVLKPRLGAGQDWYELAINVSLFIDFLDFIACPDLNTNI